MRKVGADQFYKPPSTTNSALTPSSNVVKTNKFDRYQSPITKLNQGGITAKQTQGVPITSNTAAAASSSLTASMQNSVGGSQQQTAASASLKIQSKGSKQMNQFRYGPVRPVRAVQQAGIPHTYASSGVLNSKTASGVLS